MRGRSEADAARGSSPFCSRGAGRGRGGGDGSCATPKDPPRRPPPAHPAVWEPEALYRGLWGRDPELSAEAWKELGRQAAASACPARGWAWRLLLEVLEGRLSVDPTAGIPAVRELLHHAPDQILNLLHGRSPGPPVEDRSGGPSGPAATVVAIALGQDGEGWLSELLRIAEDRDVSLRLAGIAGLGEVASSGCLPAVEGLGARLGDPHGQARWAAASALGRARGRACAERAAYWLEQAAAGGDERATSGAAFGAAALWPARHGKAMQVLLKAACSGGAGGRAAAAAMSELPRRSAARLAGICLRAEDGEVRRLCVPALARWAREGSASACRELRSLARDPLPPVRAAAAEAVAQDSDLCPPSLVSELAADRSAVVRASASAALGQRSGEEAEALLRGLARDRVGAVRASAVRSLGRLGRVDLVREATHDRDPMVRAAAAAALQASTPGDVELLVALTRDRRTEVAEEAARALGRAKAALSQQVWEHLLALASRPALSRAAAQGIAAALDATAIPPGELCERLGRLSEHVLREVARAAHNPLVGENARLLAQLHVAGDGLADALGDMSIFLSATGRREEGESFSWLARCAGAGTAEEIAATLSCLPSRRSKEIARLAGMARSVSQCLRTGSQADRERRRQRALALVEAMRLAPTTAERPSGILRPALSSVEGEPIGVPQGSSAASCAGLGWVVALRIAESWGRAIAKQAPTTSGTEVRAGIASARVVAGRRPAALVRLENLGKTPAEQITVSLGAQSASVRRLPPEGHEEVAVPLPPAEPGLLDVSGEVTFHDGQARRREVLSGRVEVIAPGLMRSRENPYVVGKPLVGDSPMFHGRAGEMAFVARALSSGQQGSVAVLVGPRRSGKTSVLKRLEVSLAGRYHPVFVDVQGMLVSDTQGFFADLTRRLLPGDESRWMTSNGLPPSRLRGAEMVREAAAHYGGKTVLLLDEFDDLEQKVRTGRLGPEVFDQLRSLIQHSEAIGFVLAGTHRLEELAGEHWSFLLNLATYRRLGPLAGGEAEALIRRPLEALGLVCEDAAVSLATRLTGRQPYLLQLLGYRLVEQCLEREEGALDVALVEAAAEEVVDQGEIHLRYLWDSAGPHGQVVLSALAQAGGWTAQSELEQATGLRSRELARAVATLKALDMLTEQSPREGPSTPLGWFCLQIGLLGRWVARLGKRL